MQVEFVSANPTGPLSTGHGRPAEFLGDCLARLAWRKWALKSLGSTTSTMAVARCGYWATPSRRRYLEELLGPCGFTRTRSDGRPRKRMAGRDPCGPPGGVSTRTVIRETISAILQSQETWSRVIPSEALVDEPGEGLFREFAHKLKFCKRLSSRLWIRLEWNFDVHFNEKSAL